MLFSHRFRLVGINLIGTNKGGPALTGQYMVDMLSHDYLFFSILKYFLDAGSQQVLVTDSALLKIGDIDPLGCDSDPLLYVPLLCLG